MRGLELDPATFDADSKFEEIGIQGPLLIDMEIKLAADLDKGEVD